MYRWLLYQVEEVVIVAVDALAWAADNIVRVPWQWVVLCLVSILFVIGLTF